MNSSSIAPIPVTTYALAVLATKPSGASSAGILASAKSLSRARLDAALEDLVASGAVERLKDKFQLTPKGRARAEQALGPIPAEKGRDHLGRFAFPALALGIAPDSAAARRLAKGDALRAAMLSRAYRLPLDVARVTLKQALASLMERGFAGVSTVASDPAVARFAAELGRAQKTEQVRRILLKMALAVSTETSQAAPGPVSSGTSSLTSFAERVLAVVAAVVSAEFPDKAAIAPIYDLYGRRHPDAGSLQSFKDRLLDARRAGLIRMLPLDQPGALPPEVVRRSWIDTAEGPVVFIFRGAVHE